MQLYDAIRQQVDAAVPFARHVGVEIVDLAPGTGIARLPESNSALNHIGTIHAGALFTLGEAASGAAMTGCFATRLTSIRPVAADARITFARVARGPLIAKAVTSSPAQQLAAQLDSDGRVVFEVDVTIEDAQTETVATMQVVWHVRQVQTPSA